MVGYCSYDVYGNCVWLCSGMDHCETKSGPFLATLMGQFFARGMAYIITLASLTIKDPTYRWLALTKLKIPPS